MIEKILDYRKVTSLEQARKVVEHFKKIYDCAYDWGYSYGDIEEAIAVCVLEINSYHKYVTTTSVMRYIERIEVVKAIDIGDL